MLYWLLTELQESYSFLNVFRYITFRSGLAALTSLVLVLWMGKPFIRYIQRKQYGQAVRDDGPETHLKKQGTPTMGGVLILFGLSAGTLLWADLANPYTWLLLAITWLFGAIGLLDDAKKVLYKDPKGLASRWKWRLQVFAALLVAWGFYVLQKDLVISGQLFFPFFKNFSIDMGPWYLALAVLVMVGASNAVNLTDGLDGLAIGPCIVNVATFFILCYLGGNAVFANYLQIPHIPQAGELAVFCAALLAAGVGFLWFNAYPAQIFMGDVGALSLGGAIGALAVATKHEILLVILGGIFVMETVSVIVQVVSFKLTGRRVFKMAPLHHHFELIGWPEPKVIVRFWILSFIFALIALSTLKLR
jgi:phospho-N-acetylmuramoyl-pentapeptide-transferase